MYLVGLSDYRTVGLLDRRIIGVSDYRYDPELHVFYSKDESISSVFVSFVFL